MAGKRDVRNYTPGKTKRLFVYFLIFFKEFLNSKVFKLFLRKVPAICFLTISDIAFSFSSPKPPLHQIQASIDHWVGRGILLKLGKQYTVNMFTIPKWVQKLQSVVSLDGSSYFLTEAGMAILKEVADSPQILNEPAVDQILVDCYVLYLINYQRQGGNFPFKFCRELKDLKAVKERGDFYEGFLRNRLGSALFLNILEKLDMNSYRFNEIVFKIL